jgi:hypothetical protein
MSRKNKPDVILLAKSSKKNKKQRSNIIEYIQQKDDPIIPLNLVEGIFISLVSGEKYKISKKAIRTDIVLEDITDILGGLGVPDDIQTVEIVLDIEDAEKAIVDETRSILDKVFAD